MSFLLRQVAHCDVCGHEWIVIAKKTPSHCASCKSRKWNQADPLNQPTRTGSGFRDAVEAAQAPERIVEYGE